MTEASGGSGRAGMERTIVQRSMEDEEFRQRLLDDPGPPWSGRWGGGCPRVFR